MLQSRVSVSITKTHASQTENVWFQELVFSPAFLELFASKYTGFLKIISEVLKAS